MDWCYLLMLVLIFISEGYAEYKRVCYYTNWSQYRPGAGKFMPSDIEADLCTHLIYAFGKLENNKIRTFEWNDDQLYKTFNGLKQENRQLKTLLAIGGWTAASGEFTKMVSSSGNRKVFVDQSIVFLRQHGFDGLDLDWEYPALRGGVPSDKENFGILCQELRTAYEAEAARTGNGTLLLTAAVAAGKGNVDAAYDVPVIAQALDFINLMSYDLHGSWESVTGHNSPLFSKASESPATRKQLNIEWAANYWVTLGTPKSKLIIGLATFGRSFRLTNPTQHGIGDPASGAGTAGNFTRENGFLSYYEVCREQVTGQGQTYRDSEQLVPYYVDGNQWVGFDDEQSLSTKVSWLTDQEFGGAMIWSLPLDDFNLICTNSTRKFQLTKVIKDQLKAAETGQQTSFSPPAESSSTSPASSTVTVSSSAVTSRSAGSTTLPVSTTVSVTTASTTSGTTTGFTCNGKSDGDYPDPINCAKFITCLFGKPLSRNCAPGLYWNKAGHCDWPANVQCNITPPQTSTSTTTQTPPPTTTNAIPTKTESPTSITSTTPPPSTTTSSITTPTTTSTTTSTTTPTSTSTTTPTSTSTTTSTTTPTTTSTTTSTTTTSQTTTTLSPTTSTPTTSTSTTTPLPTTTTPSPTISTPTTTTSTTTPSPTTTTPQSVTTRTSGSTGTTTGSTSTVITFTCTGKANGNYPDPNNCSKYITCSNGIKFSWNCNPGLLWNSMGYCDWPRNVVC